MAEREGKALKVIVGVILITLLVFAFVKSQDDGPQAQELASPQTVVEEALMKGGVPFDKVLISTGREVAEAFNLNKTTIPEALRVAVVIMKEPFAEGDAGTYKKAIDSVLDADHSLGGVLLFVTREWPDSYIIYANRTLAETLRSQGLRSGELLDRWYVLNATAGIS
ncbi:MAG: hypothetical protein Q8P59_09690 [Dehalococcoidia bacterium]|nr:hypothetical protein [Dehalococcoidia bacterium]